MGQGPRTELPADAVGLQLEVPAAHHEEVAPPPALLADDLRGAQSEVARREEDLEKKTQKQITLLRTSKWSFEDRMRKLHL